MTEILSAQEVAKQADQNLPARLKKEREFKEWIRKHDEATVERNLELFMKDVKASMMANLNSAKICSRDYDDKLLNKLIQRVKKLGYISSPVTSVTEERDDEMMGPYTETLRCANISWAHHRKSSG